MYMLYTYSYKYIFAISTKIVYNFFKVIFNNCSNYAKYVFMLSIEQLLFNK